MDLRLRDFIRKSGPEHSRIGLIEFPSDQGVFINRGRQGSSKAPELIKAGLYNLTPHPVFYDEHTELLESVWECDRIGCTGDLPADQDLLAKAVAGELNKESIPLIIGGGHETSYGHFLGYIEAKRDVTILNIDAHADVRELKEGKGHSGSPFFQALNHPSERCKEYHVFGLNPSSVAGDHYRFVNQNGSAHFSEETTVEKVVNCLNSAGHDVMVTMDMDAVSQSDAPGVSAPNTSGMRSELWLQLAFEFGRHPKVASFDLCEVNPLYDMDNQTVRLAARTIWNFLLGVAFRGIKK
jgi:formiminoglutamase